MQLELKQKLQQQLEQQQKQQRQQQLEQQQELMQQLEQLLQQLVLVQLELLLFYRKRLKRLLTGKLIIMIFSFVDFQYIKINKRQIEICDE